MGYFSNGTAGEMYERRWCSRCRHRDGIDGSGCAVWHAHMLYNYDECNKDNSILHMLIPRSADKLSNNQCRMFVEEPVTRHSPMTRADLEYLLQQAIEKERQGGEK